MKEVLHHHLKIGVRYILLPKKFPNSIFQFIGMVGSKMMLFKHISGKCPFDMDDNGYITIWYNKEDEFIFYEI